MLLQVFNCAARPNDERLAVGMKAIHLDLELEPPLFLIRTSHQAFIFSIGTVNYLAEADVVKSLALDLSRPVGNCGLEIKYFVIPRDINLGEGRRALLTDYQLPEISGLGWLLCRSGFPTFRTFLIISLFESVVVFCLASLI